MNLSWASAKFRVPLRRHRSSDRQPDRPQDVESVSAPAPGLSVGQTASSSNTPLDSGQPSSDAPKRNSESLRHTVWHGIRNVLGIVYDSADILPPLKSALGGVAAILRTLDVSLFMMKRFILRIESGDNSNTLGTRKRLRRL
jgi:hypothetical protein